MEMWELVAREQIRDTLARYNWSGDAGRLDELADTFCAKRIGRFPYSSGSLRGG
jgi:SnoaL-like domain